MNAIMDKITCIIVDDEKHALDRLLHIITEYTELDVIYATHDSDNAIEQICLLNPDIVFTDVEMPNKTGLQLIKEVRGKGFFPQFIMVTAYNHYAIKAIKEAAFDYLIKPVDIDELNQAIDRYKRHKGLMTDDRELNPSITSCLTEREKEILQLIIEGLTSKQIAEKLFISKTTVDTHRKNIMERTNTNSTVELIAHALKR